MGSVSVRHAGICLFVLLLAGIVGNTAANIPLMISYQGKVTDSGGTPVADGSYTMRFRIYDDATAGTLEWDSGNQSVQVSGGIFNVLLGQSPQPALTLYFDEDYWLLVTFSGANQSPRQQLASVGYAYMASGLVPGTLIQGSVTSVTSSAIKAVNTATSGTRYGGAFQTDASEGRAVYGFASHSSGTNYGGKFHSHSTNGIGVYGKAEGTTGSNYGGYFETSSTEWGWGVYGLATSTLGNSCGVYGETTSTLSRGVVGKATATHGYTWGVYGESASTLGRGVYGEVLAESGFTVGVHGSSSSPSGYGGYFEGDVHVIGNLTKSSGSFLIDHPLDPENKLLRHNFVESPENLLIYRGKATLDQNGEAIVEMPEYFCALVEESEATVNLTPIGKGFLTAYEFSENRKNFRILGDPKENVAWTVYAERDDPVIHQLARPVEEEKGPDSKYCDRGKLLHPIAYGYPETMGRNYELHEIERRQMEEERTRMKEERARREEERAREECEHGQMTEAARPLR